MVGLMATATFAVARGQLQAGPTLLEIGPRGGATRLVLRNTGDVPVSAQIRSYAWHQSDGEDRLTASDLLVASPPIVELPPGGKQLVRIVLVGPLATDRDQSFRIVVDELPSDDDNGDSWVALRMRYVIPAFVRANDPVPATLSCVIDAMQSHLSCRNSGGRPAQLGASRLLGGDGQSIELSKGLFGYVLPGSTRSSTVPADAGDLIHQASHLETSLDGQLTTLAIDRVR